jgi:uncharacterized membrane protein
MKNLSRIGAMEKQTTVKTIFLWILAVAMMGVGIEHFRNPQFFVKIMPAYLPWHLELVYISGVFEILGGIGLLIPKTRKAAAWGLVTLYICVFPANINHAINNIPVNGKELHPAILWGRLPLQAVLIYWAWVFTKAPPQPTDNEEQ